MDDNDRIELLNQQLSDIDKFKLLVKEYSQNKSLALLAIDSDDEIESIAAKEVLQLFEKDTIIRFSR